MIKEEYGFTLMELLAIIIVLGIVALISIPIIQNSIYKSKKEAFKISVYSIFEAYEAYKIKNTFNEEKMDIFDLSFSHKENFISGKVYQEGNIVRVENVSSKNFCANGGFENLQIVDKSCEQSDITAPTIISVTSEVTKDSIKIYTVYNEGESFLSKHEYRIAQETEDIEQKEWINGDVLTESLSTKFFENLNKSTTYTIQIRLSNTALENNVSEIKEIMVTTLSIEKPVIILLTDKEYAEKKEIKIVYPSGTGLLYEYSLDGENWISTNEKENVLMIEENKTIRARVYDGNNYAYAEPLMISGIDKTKPVVTITKNVLENKNILSSQVEPTSIVSGYRYTWYKDGSILGGENTSTLETITSGIYQLKVTTGAGIESTSNEIEIGAYTIIYNLNGGTGNIGSQTKIEDLPLTLTSIIPKREGYQFQGWGITNTDKIPSYTGGENYTKNENITLYAIWKSAGVLIGDKMASSSQVSTRDPDGNKRYVGTNPDNYVKFNNELWRIIGVFNGQAKIIRNTATSYKYASNGKNNWINASLKTDLDITFYNSIDSVSKTYIDINHVWRLGGVSSTKSSWTPKYVYNAEKGTSVYSGNATTWTGTIALMYASDYGYSTSSSCDSISLYSWSKTANKHCLQNSWIFNGNSGNYNFLNTTSSAGNLVLFVSSSTGRVNSHSVVLSVLSNPTLYLKSTVKIIGGSGTSSNPYILGL